MKKWIAVSLALACVLLTACGKNADTKDSDVKPESTAKEEKIDASENEAAKETNAAPITEEPDEVKPLHLNIDYKSVSYSDPETYVYYMEYEDERVILSEEDALTYPALAAVLEKELSKRNSSYQSEVDELIKTYMDEKNHGDDAAYNLSSTTTIKRSDSLVLSFLESASDYIGGAHGNYDVCGYNYDTVTGKTLKFSDVVSDPVAFLKLADEKIQASFNSESEIPSGLEDFYESYDTSIIWTIDYQGVKIYFNPYTLGSYALGMIETEIYFSEAPELFNSKYLNIPESYVMELQLDEFALLDIDCDGQCERITRYLKRDGSYVYGADIDVDDKTFSIDGEPEHYYYVANNGKNYIFVSVLYEGDYKTIATIDLSSMKMDSNDYTEGYLAIFNNGWKDEGGQSEYNCTREVFTDPDRVMLSTYIQYLGTMSGRGYYHMGDESHLVADTGVYSIDTESIITASMDIECEQVDFDGNVIGKAVIPEGTKLVVRRGDGETFADLIEVPADAVDDEYEYYEYLNRELKMEDADIIYRVRGELGEYGAQAIINGLEEYQVFDNILYAD